MGCAGFSQTLDLSKLPSKNHLFGWASGTSPYNPCDPFFPATQDFPSIFFQRLSQDYILPMSSDSHSQHLLTCSSNPETSQKPGSPLMDVCMPAPWLSPVRIVDTHGVDSSERIVTARLSRSFVLSLASSLKPHRQKLEAIVQSLRTASPCHVWSMK